MRDPETGNSKGYAFINFASFEASDAAIEAMNGQHLCNRPISVSYAFKKEARGERHGTGEGFYNSFCCILVMFEFLVQSVCWHRRTPCHSQTVHINCLQMLRPHYLRPLLL